LSCPRPFEPGFDRRLDPGTDSPVKSVINPQFPCGCGGMAVVIGSASRWMVGFDGFPFPIRNSAWSLVSEAKFLRNRTDGFILSLAKTRSRTGKREEKK
jgi:hypothetical protein